MKMYVFLDEAFAIHRAADPYREYHFRDSVTGDEIHGKSNEVKAFILHHDMMNNDKTSWGPVDVSDVEAWALLETIYN